MPLDLVDARLQVVFCDVGDDSAVGIGDGNTDIACGLEVDRDGGVVKSLERRGRQLFRASRRGGIFRTAGLGHYDSVDVDESPVRDVHGRILATAYDLRNSRNVGISVIVPAVAVAAVFVVYVEFCKFGLVYGNGVAFVTTGGLVSVGKNAVALKRE